MIGGGRREFNQRSYEGSQLIYIFMGIRALCLYGGGGGGGERFDDCFWSFVVLDCGPVIYCGGKSCCRRCHAAPLHVSLTVAESIAAAAPAPCPPLFFYCGRGLSPSLPRSSLRRHDLGQLLSDIQKEVEDRIDEEKAQAARARALTGPSFPTILWLARLFSRSSLRLPSLPFSLLLSPSKGTSHLCPT